MFEGQNVCIQLFFLAQKFDFLNYNLSKFCFYKVTILVLRLNLGEFWCLRSKFVNILFFLGQNRQKFGVLRSKFRF